MVAIVGRELTVTVNVRMTMLLLAPPSLTVSVIVAEPEALANGVNFKEPVVLAVVYVTVGFGIRPVLLEPAVTVSVWFSLAAPELMPERFTVCCPAFWLIQILFSAFNVGV